MIVPACFIFLNSVAFALLSPEHFQRLGSLWVGIFLVVFLFLGELVDELFKGDLAARKIAEKVNLPAEVRVQLREKVREKFSDKSHDDEKIDSAIHFVIAGRVEEQLDRLKPKLRNYLSWTEVALLFAATIQWGYGDLLHCFLHGLGWGKCY